MADNIDENVEEVELEISQINSDEFDFTEVTQKSYTETTIYRIIRFIANQSPFVSLKLSNLFQKPIIIANRISEK